MASNSMELFFVKSGDPAPPGYKLLKPRGEEKIQPKYLTPFMTQLIREFPHLAGLATTREGMEKLSENAKKFIETNQVQIYGKKKEKNSAANTEMEEEVEYTGEESFAPEGYGAEIYAKEQQEKAAASAARKEARAEAAAMAALTGSMAGLSAPSGRARIFQEMRRIELYKTKAQALLDEARAVITTGSLELREKASEQYNFAEMSIDLADRALEKLRKNLGELGGKRKTHRHRRSTHRRKTYRRKTYRR